MNMDDALQSRALQLLRHAGILPVVTVHGVDEAIAVAGALQRGGLDTIELTLRTPAALDAIRAIKREWPGLGVGAGTVLTASAVDAAIAAGADFLITPGVSPALLDALVAAPVPVVPGAATPSELLALAERGVRVAKLFPASVVGGIGMLKALQGPLPDMRLCPTGGIAEDDAADYLAQANVVCIGGSWMVPHAWLQAGDYARVTASAHKARAIVNAARRPAVAG